MIFEIFSYYSSCSHDIQDLLMLFKLSLWQLISPHVIQVILIIFEIFLCHLSYPYDIRDFLLSFAFFLMSFKISSQHLRCLHVIQQGMQENSMYYKLYQFTAFIRKLMNTINYETSVMPIFFTKPEPNDPHLITCPNLNRIK